MYKVGDIVPGVGRIETNHCGLPWVASSAPGSLYMGVLRVNDTYIDAKSGKQLNLNQMAKRLDNKRFDYENRAGARDALKNMAKAIVKHAVVRGFKVEVFSQIKGWYFPVELPERDNPAAIFRSLMIRAGKYPKNKEECAGWDKTLGELYRYSEGRIKGFIVDRRIPMHRPGEWPIKKGKKR